MQIKVKVLGIQRTKQNIQRRVARTKRMMAQGLLSEGHMLLERSKPLVPSVTGALRESGSVEGPFGGGAGSVMVSVGYGGPAAPYAGITHENERAGKTGGVSPKGKQYPAGSYALDGQAKFLTEPLKEQLPGMAARIAAFIRSGRHYKKVPLS